MEPTTTSPSIEALVEEAKSWINLNEEYVSLSVNRFAAMAFAVAADFNDLRDALENTTANLDGLRKELETKR